LEVVQFFAAYILPPTDAEAFVVDHDDWGQNSNCHLGQDTTKCENGTRKVETMAKDILLENV
jgi:hypothetical protein